MLMRSLCCLLLVLSVLACRESHVQEVKNFRIFVDTDTPALKYSVQILVRDYNRRIGFEALTVVEKSADGNSLIYFREGLINDNRKLGLGQWTSMQKQNIKGTFVQNSTTTIEYGMEIVFDRENFLSKSAFVQDSESESYKHLFHLFSHEVGHGMHMNHDADVMSVMYPSIPESGSRTLDYSAYFEQIRRFIDQPMNKPLAQEPDDFHGEHGHGRSLL